MRNAILAGALALGMVGCAQNYRMAVSAERAAQQSAVIASRAMRDIAQQDTITSKKSAAIRE